MKEFERGNRDREVALHELSNRSRKMGESVQTYAFKIGEPVKLAYPDFTEAARGTVAKDNSVKGFNSEMQLALKSLTNFESANLKTLVDNASRLELAGIKSASNHENNTLY